MTAPAATRTPIRHKSLNRAVLITLAVLAAALGSLTGLMLVYSVDLPQIADLEHYRPSTITELYDIHGRLFGSFALERRVVVPYDGFSPTLRAAVISIEDKNFESHWGVNVFRVLGAVYHDLRAKGRAQGASTLTMQLARNLFLSNQRTAARKLEEVLLSIQIERSFTKQQIFVLYGNQIYLGQGVYGFEAGAEYYFNKHASELTLTEAALLAGLPKGPSEFSPLVNADRALRRRNQVLNAMLEDGRITLAEADAARSQPLGLHLEPAPNSEAPWFVEEVRRELDRQLGADRVYADGLRVYTTLDLDLQRTANRAVLDGLAAYERRHGWHGHLLNVLAGQLDPDAFHHPDWAADAGAAPPAGNYVHALVTGVLPSQVSARVGHHPVTLHPDDWAWTGFHTAPEFLKRGDLIYIRITGTDTPHLPGAGPSSLAVRDQATTPIAAVLEQDSGVEGSLLAMDNVSGDVLAMVGGRDFNLSQYNRAVQSVRQVGSAFKPYVYTAAIEEGATPNQIILDAPTSFGTYTPHNYEGNYLGPITLTKAFADSRNIPAVKLAARVGMPRVIETAHRFGITANIPSYLPVALGAVEITLEQQVAAYSVFPNDGVRVAPRLIRRITTADGMPLPGHGAPVTQVTTTRTARTMTTLLREVTSSGTAAGAAERLGHPIGGKTGTTSSYTDAWFLGFSPTVTCGVWVGYDNRLTLGDKETGAVAALPIWMDFMAPEVAAHPDERFPADLPPAGQPHQ